MCQFIKWHTACCFRVYMDYNKYISKRGGMYHRKRKRSTLPLPSFFFFLNKQKNKGINTFGTYYRHLTGDPGGSSLVSYDTKQTTEQKTPLTFLCSVYFPHLPVTVPILSLIGLTFYEMPIKLYALIVK